MKKNVAAILVLGVVSGLLLFCAAEGRLSGGSGLTEARSVRMGNTAEEAPPGVKAGETAFDGSAEDMGQDPDDTQKRIALTFDDGPHPQYTAQLLDGLKERGVRATFFVTGEHAKLHPDLIERMRDEGHLIGNHTYSHIQLRKNNREQFKKELIETNKVIEDITGEEVQYVRPPYGSWDKSFERELNMFPVLWTIDPLDWCSRNSACVVRKVLEEAGENDIILLHDYYDSSVTAALEIVDELLREGYTFVTVEEILFD